VSAGSEAPPILSKSKACFEVVWLERDEGDLDLRRERRGGRGRGGGGEGGMMGLEDAVRLLGILKPRPSFSLPLHPTLSLPEEEEAVLRRDANKRETKETRKMQKNSLALQPLRMHKKTTINQSKVISLSLNMFMGM